MSGSPDITVTNVSAQDVQVGGALTVTGNLTVNGTTTTIDTVVTAVDSLAVDGNVTAQAFIGNGGNLLDCLQVLIGVINHSSKYI